MTEPAGLGRSNATSEEDNSHFRTIVGGPEDRQCKYIKKSQIGRGASGSAYVVERRSDGELFVAKEMDLESMSANARRYAYSEIRCLDSCDHFAIMKFEEDIEEGGRLLLITEFGDAGDLRRHIKNRYGDGTKPQYFPEPDIWQIFVQILLAVNHIHSKRMLHRDIKTANVFLSSTGLIKMGDFGFSAQYDETVSGAVATSLVGTPYYLAPELWKGERYGKKADMWSVGIILFELMALKRPFEAPTFRDMKQIVVSKTEIPPLPQHYSADLQNICKKMLATDPHERPDAAEILQYPALETYLQTFEGKVAVTAGLSNSLKEKIKQNIREFREQPKVNQTATPLARGAFEGTVKKESASSKQWKDRYLILDDQGNLIVALSSERSSRPGSEAAVPGNEMKAVTPIPRTIIEFGFEIHLQSGQVLRFQAKSAADRQAWIDNIQRVVGKFN
jgi:serine/threonine protein kinase